MTCTTKDSNLQPSDSKSDILSSWTSGAYHVSYLYRIIKAESWKILMFLDNLKNIGIVLNRIAVELPLFHHLDTKFKAW